MISLKEGRGRVPIRNSTENEATPYLLVDFPKRSTFDVIYSKHKSQELRDKYWDILQHRARGKTLEESVKPYGITRERVRQIEARFQRLVGERYWEQMNRVIVKLSELQHLVELSSSSEMHEMSLLSDDNR